MKATIDQLRNVRKKLARSMIVKSNGYRYLGIFGCPKNIAHLVPCVHVRVELNPTGFGTLTSRFDVFVDFHGPLGLDIDHAEAYEKAARAAVRKAKWAKKIVDGLEWEESIILEEIRRNQVNAKEIQW